jgi:hypothetical protein
MNLLLNAVQCLSCDEVIVSRHRHDFKSCKCGNVSVDGGLEYKRRAFKTEATFVECCAYTYTSSTKPGDAAGKFIVWSPGGKTNPGVIFDRQSDAELSAKELAVRVPPSDWYVAQLSHVPRS